MVKIPGIMFSDDPKVFKVWHRLNELDVALIFMVRRDRSGVVELNGEALDPELAVTMLEAKAFNLFKQETLGHA